MRHEIASVKARVDDTTTTVGRSIVSIGVFLRDLFVFDRVHQILGLTLRFHALRAR